MRFIDRLKMAIGWWGSEGKSAASWLSTWQNDTPSYIVQSFQNSVKHGWYRNELIFACIHKTANTASQVQLRAYSNKSGLPIDDHPVRRLINRPNPFMSEFDFWYSVIGFTRLAGIAAYEKERNAYGETVRLWPLRPDWVAVIPSSTSFIGGYEYRIPGEKPKPLSNDDILVFKTWDPLNVYGGRAPVLTATRVRDVDNSSTDYMKLFFEKGGAPPGLLKTIQKLSDPQVTDIRRRWRERYGGWEHWMEPAILDKDATYQRIGLTFQEMGMGVLDARNEARICMVLDVPPIIVGAKVGLDRATYANYKEARAAWWEDSLVPLYTSFLDVIQYGLFQEMNTSRAYLAWDFSKVPAMQEERSQRWTRANAALTSGAITVNEYREEIGLPNLGPSGDVFLRNANIIQTLASPRGDDAGKEEEEGDGEKAIALSNNGREKENLWDKLNYTDAELWSR